MSLYFDSHADGPRLHAFIIGVGDYRHLDANSAEPARLLNGLGSLTCTPLAAKSIVRWLEEEYNNRDCPLGTIELLLSPAETITRLDTTEVTIEAATMANITAAFKRWFQRCDRDAQNIAFFYFAGHGVSQLTQFLFASDFGDPIQPDDWENCLNFTAFKSGMRRNKAQTQLFFVDACRNTPNDVLKTLAPQGKALVTAAIDDKVALSAAYLAASEGRPAFGPNDEETYFCQALLLCLRGAGARNIGPNVRWRVDTAVLSSALITVVETLAVVHNQPLTSECQVQKPVAFHFPPEGKAVLCVICRPRDLGNQAEITVIQDGRVIISPLGERRPWMRCINTGHTRVEVGFQNFIKEIQEHQAMPPTCEVEVIR